MRRWRQNNLIQKCLTFFKDKGFWARAISLTPHQDSVTVTLEQGKMRSRKGNLNGPTKAQSGASNIR